MRNSGKEGIVKLYKNDKTVFTINDIAILWREKNRDSLRVRIKYFADKGDLLQLRRGVYAKENYNPLEAATKIYNPSYISFETVLRKEGVIFQHYDTIFAASYLSREIKLNDGAKIHYRRIKDEMLLNEIGLKYGRNYTIATKERAFVDMVYLFGLMHYDNLKSMDWKLCKEIAHAYGVQSLIANINKYKKDYAST